MNSTLLLSLLLFVSCCLDGILAFVPSPLLQQRQASYSTTTQQNLSSSSEEAERLRQSASKLRQEAEALQKNLDPTTRKKQTLTNAPLPTTYTSLKDSTWVLSYRFSNEPEFVNENDQTTNSRETYSGKLTVTFRSDGYTDLISHEPSGRTLLDIEKVWGWDEEDSNKDDDNVYLLFSVSARANDDKKDRFYWQARVNTNERTKEITLDDGTVTVKRDVKPPGGFWGVFNGGGILAQFRNVGSFVGKPTRMES